MTSGGGRCHVFSSTLASCADDETSETTMKGAGGMVASIVSLPKDNFPK